MSLNYIQTSVWTRVNTAVCNPYSSILCHSGIPNSRWIHLHSWHYCFPPENDATSWQCQMSIMGTCEWHHTTKRLEQTRIIETTINAKHFIAFCHFQDESSKCYTKLKTAVFTRNCGCIWVLKHVNRINTWQLQYALSLHIFIYLIVEWNPVNVN